ncbi:hypothetical protein [Nannocystis pusilla]|uniref:Lipoprotein n=1 Tax=Nannocystis pusilla TaxID=889268 RepID=A0ABS7TVJ1_9BACT|nr:hypothetical protein [Nannocystis pusilla]MBZ5712272.1 hypothetical protein [Nannocystis pusilla]
MPSISRSILVRAATGALLSTLVLGCQPPPNDGVADPDSARRAYLGLDRAVDRMIKLGFDGFNAASNANIPEQMEAGELSGTMVVGGKVDQGASNNKEMDLQVTLTDYSDGPVEDMFDVVYDGGPALLDISLRDLPAGTLTGSFTGEFAMTGELGGVVALDLDISGETEEAPDGTIRRKAGTIHVVGTATSDYGVFEIDVSL